MGVGAGDGVGVGVGGVGVGVGGEGVVAFPSILTQSISKIPGVQASRQTKLMLL